MCIAGEMTLRLRDDVYISSFLGYIFIFLQAYFTINPCGSIFLMSAARLHSAAITQKTLSWALHKGVLNIAVHHFLCVPVTETHEYKGHQFYP